MERNLHNLAIASSERGGCRRALLSATDELCRCGDAGRSGNQACNQPPSGPGCPGGLAADASHGLEPAGAGARAAGAPAGRGLRAASPAAAPGSSRQDRPVGGRSGLRASCPQCHSAAQCSSHHGQQRPARPNGGAWRCSWQLAARQLQLRFIRERAACRSWLGARGAADGWAAAGPNLPPGNRACQLPRLALHSPPTARPFAVRLPVATGRNGHVPGDSVREPARCRPPAGCAGGLSVASCGGFLLSRAS
mmetsp:Transcript_16253/g.47495  ORF Transcript_16253/g.47495 Transcript_16253/m.47495 type:complete len:251 (+) Transcript_16253:638-1390(+)